MVTNRAMANTDSRVTIHMVASLDGFIARRDGSVDWLETSDEFAGGESMDPSFVEAFLETIDCYVMGSRTYETAIGFETKGLGWAYGDKPTFVLTSRELPRTRDTVQFHSGDLTQFVNELRPRDSRKHPGQHVGIQQIPFRHLAHARSGPRPAGEKPFRPENPHRFAIRGA